MSEEKIKLGGRVKLLYPFQIGALTPGKNIEYYDLEKGLVFVTFLTDNEAKIQSGPKKGTTVQMEEQPTSVLPLSLPVFKAGPPPYTPFRHPYNGIGAPFKQVEGLDGVYEYNITDPSRAGRYSIHVPDDFTVCGKYELIPLHSNSGRTILTADRVTLEEVAKYLTSKTEPFPIESMIGEVVHIVVTREKPEGLKIIYPSAISTAFGRSASTAKFYIHIKIGTLQFPMNIKFLQAL